MSPQQPWVGGTVCWRLDTEADTLPYCQLESDLDLKLNVEKINRTADLPSVLCLSEIIRSYSTEENGLDIALGKGTVETICF